jgi:hypothetical protein
MTTALRPVLGQSDQFLPGEKRCFLSHWMEYLKQGEDAAKPRTELRRD